MAEPITWTNERRRLSDLIPWKRNPRQVKARGVELLQESYKDFGQVETIAIGPENELYNGHQRLKSWAAKYGDIEIDVRVSSRALTEKERERLTVLLHKGAAGEWDFDTLANEFELADLVEWGFAPYELGMVGDPDDPNKEWQGMPEFDREPLAFRSLHVHFKSQEDIDEFAQMIGQKITDKTRSIWHPEAEKRDLKSQGYITNES